MFVFSERADSTGATGDRLKEGSAINKSLSTLGNCIKGKLISYNTKTIVSDTVCLSVHSGIISLAW